MRMKPVSIPRSSKVAFTLAAVIGLGACSGGFNPARDVASALGAGPKMAATPDFVAKSRPTNLDYIPVGATTDGRPTPARSADEVKAQESELDALRTRNEAAGAAAAEAGKTPPPEPVKLPTNTSQPTVQKKNSKKKS
jgi:hypothetical protein